MYPLELEAASGADELDAVDVAILEEDDLCSPVFVLQYLEEDDLCFRNPSTPAFRTPAQFQQTLSTILCVQWTCIIADDSARFGRSFSNALCRQDH